MIFVKFYPTYWLAIKSIWRIEGPHAFFLGLTPSLLLTAIQTGIQFATYRLLTKIMLPFHESQSVFTSDLY